MFDTVAFCEHHTTRTGFFASVVGSSGHSIVTDNTGTTYAWGTANYVGVRFISLAIKGRANLAIGDNGKVHTWGHGRYGQVGDGAKINRSVPVEVKILGGENFVQVDGANAHSFALTATGKIYVWGFNKYGSLGDGTATDRETPVEVKTAKKVVSLSTNYYHTLALTAEGETLVWGSNYSGEFGNGTTNNSSIPIVVQLAKDSKIVSISAGHNRSLATTSNETGLCLGQSWTER